MRAGVEAQVAGDGERVGAAGFAKIRCMNDDDEGLAGGHHDGEIGWGWRVAAATESRIAQITRANVVRVVGVQVSVGLQIAVYLIDHIEVDLDTSILTAVVGDFVSVKGAQSFGVNDVAQLRSRTGAGNGVADKTTKL